MTSNDQVLLRQILQQTKADRAPELSDSKFFELFVAEQVLKNFDLSDDEVEVGITGSGNDGGVDAMYSFANGKLLLEDTNLSMYKKGVTFELFIIQTKLTAAFEGTALDKLLATTNDILDLSKPLPSLRLVYDEKLIQAVANFRRAQEELASKFPKLRVTYIYASLGDSQQVHPNVNWKADQLQLYVANYFPHSEFKFSFLGARDLLDLARKTPSTSIQVTLLDSIATGKQAYLALITLKDYYEFITDDDGNLRKYIFDANVRDYQGKIEVNQGIRKTLESNESEDFWWLNNGITIIATDASIAGKTISLEDPQIVNGLQTSTEIYEYFAENPKIQIQETRSILVRIIVTASPASQDKIIRATNSQTAIPLASLKATDGVQRDIEEFFWNKGFYYDRRKNFYKNQRHPREKIISIPYLAQAVTAIVLQQPNEARARPSSILKKDTAYKQIFSRSYPLMLYLNCIKILKIADSHIKSNTPNTLSEERNNLRFHFALYIAISMIGKINYGPEEIAHLEPNDINEDLLSRCWDNTLSVFRQYRSDNKGLNPDTVGKSKEFVEALLRGFSESLAKT